MLLNDNPMTIEHLATWVGKYLVRGPGTVPGLRKEAPLTSDWGEFLEKSGGLACHEPGCLREGG